MARDPVYVYVCWGRSPQPPRELRYSIETLLPEIGGDASRVAIFTDRPENFRDLPFAVFDVAADIASGSAAGLFHLRAKPLVLARALRLYRRPCVLLDTDSFVRAGFDATVRSALEAGAGMNLSSTPTPIPISVLSKPISPVSGATSSIPSNRGCSIPASSQRARSMRRCSTTRSS